MISTHRIGQRGKSTIPVFAIACALLTSPTMNAQAASGAKPEQAPPATAKPQGETHITPEQGKELFRSVDELIKFASDDTGLPIHNEVKRTLTSRAEVEKYLVEKFNDDEDSKRMQRGEIVLKKFGLLDRDFNLKPFMLALLKEQIAGYYDSKTKTVYMLDWVDPETQKQVLVHELTHALQDQHTDLEKWNDQTPADPSHNVGEDNDHLAKDELDTARTAALEGQAMAVFVDYSLKPTGRSLIKDPEILDQIQSQMSGSEDSPVLARAPPFDDDLDAKRIGHGQDLRDDDRGERAGADGVGEGAIDLDGVDGELIQIGKTGIASAEVVDVELVSAFAQFADGGDSQMMVGSGALGELQVDALRGDAMFAQQLLEHGQELRIG